jgi:hypothetical protein
MPPVTTVAAAVSQPLSTERSVSVGLLLVELVAAARRDRAGRVDVRLTVAGDTFILDVIDDRAAEGETDGLRARLVGLLAVQLRGTVTRRANRAGPGLAVCLRFSGAGAGAGAGRGGGIGAWPIAFYAIELSQKREVSTGAAAAISPIAVTEPLPCAAGRSRLSPCC